MKLVKAASYALTVISFVRKIVNKISMADTDRIRFSHQDSSGCYNIVIDGLPILYSYDKNRAVNIAREIINNCESITQEIFLIENDDLESVSPTEFCKISGISKTDVEYLCKLEY